MAVNKDFRDLFSALSDEGVDYIVTGAHAAMFYAAPQHTKTLDIWVRPSESNAQRTHQALQAFGAPMSELEPSDLAVTGTIFQIGVARNRIDITTSVEGVDFDEAWRGRVQSTYGGLPIAILGRNELIKNKRALGRPENLLDLESLQSTEEN